MKLQIRAVTTLREWLLKQDQSVVAELLVFCGGQTVHAVRLPHESPTQERFVGADRLANAVNLDIGGLVGRQPGKLRFPCSPKGMKRACRELLQELA